MQPKALLFDFDGVILDTEWPIYLTWLNFFQKHGQELPLETYIKCIGSDFATWSPEKHFEELTGLTPDWAEFHITRNIEIRKEVAKLDAMPGIRECLELAQSKNIPCVVVSSSQHNWVDRWIEKIGLRDLFQDTICRGDAPQIKPAPDLFQEACIRLNLPPSECLVIEDSLNGMKAAHEAGCPVVAIPNRITQCIDFSDAECQFDSLTEFYKFLSTTQWTELT